MYRILIFPRRRIHVPVVVEQTWQGHIYCRRMVQKIQPKITVKETCAARKLCCDYDRHRTNVRAYTSTITRTLIWTDLLNPRITRVRHSCVYDIITNTRASVVFSRKRCTCYVNGVSLLCDCCRVSARQVRRRLRGDRLLLLPFTPATDMWSRWDDYTIFNLFVL